MMTETLKFRGKAFVSILLNSLLIAGLVLGISALTSKDENAIRREIAQNAQTTRNGVAAVVCILNIEPEQRNAANLNDCLEVNGFEREVKTLGEPTNKGSK